MPAPHYPPPGHVLRLLGLEIEPRGTGALRLRAPISSAVVHEHGGMTVGAVATAVDVAGGMLAARAVYPDWIATANLSVDLTRLPAAAQLVVDARVMRAGRGAAVLDAVVGDDDGVCGHGLLTFSRLERRDTNPDVGPGGVDLGATVRFASDVDVDGEPGAEGAVTLAVAAGVAEPGPGVARLELTEAVRNSLGSLQGGLLGLLAEHAATSCASARRRRRWVVLDLQIDYLAVARTGPVEATASVLRDDGTTMRCRVEVHDTGADRCAARAVVTVRDLD